MAFVSVFILIFGGEYRHNLSILTINNRNTMILKQDKIGKNFIVVDGGATLCWTFSAGWSREGGIIGNDRLCD